MSYTKTTWGDGDVITAGKLNNIENGIAENETQIANIMQSISDIYNQISNIETRIEALENQLA